MGSKKKTQKKTSVKRTPPTIKEKMVVRFINVKLTDDEIMSRAVEAANIQEDIEKAEAEKAEVAARVNARIKDIEPQLRKLLKEVREKCVYEERECLARYDYKNDIVEFLIDDELVDEREMTDDDRQLTFDDVDEMSQETTKESDGPEMAV